MACVSRWRCATADRSSTSGQKTSLAQVTFPILRALCCHKTHTPYRFCLVRAVFSTTRPGAQTLQHTFDRLEPSQEQVHPRAVVTIPCRQATIPHSCTFLSGKSMQIGRQQALQLLIVTHSHMGEICSCCAPLSAPRSGMQITCNTHHTGCNTHARVYSSTLFFLSQ